MSLVLFSKGIARTLNKSALAVELPKLVADAGDDVEALTELMHVALDHGLPRVADDTLLRIVRLARAGTAKRSAQKTVPAPREDIAVHVARLSELVGRALLDERAASGADLGARIASVPMLGTVWTSVLAEQEPARSILSFDKLPRVVFCAFSVDERAALGVGPTTPAAKLSRAVPLALGERLTNVCAPLFVQPVVGTSALYVATSPWALPELLMLSPLDEKPVMLVGGRVGAPAADGVRDIALDVWSLTRGTRRELRGTVDDVAELAGDISAMFGNVFPRHPGVTPRESDAKYLDALADAHLTLLVASGSVDASTLRNLDQAARTMTELAERDLPSKLLVVAFAIASLSAKLRVDSAFVDVALAAAREVERELPALRGATATLTACKRA